jgi:hypothetical protein
MKDEGGRGQKDEGGRMRDEEGRGQEDEGSLL